MVPGVLHTANLPAVIEFYFRVRRPLKASTIVIHSGDKVIRTIEKDHLIPSEMENVILAGKQLDGLSEDLVIEVKEK